MDEDIIIEGTVMDIIYNNQTNGYTVFSVDIEEQKVVCVGNVADIISGESVKLSGEWVNHPSYGKQLKVSNCEKCSPTSVEGMKKYLASGLIKGIGKKMAEKIVDRFGDETFTIIEQEPNRLSEIKGITVNKAIEVGVIFAEQHSTRNAMMYLQDLGISPVFALKIYRKYKDKLYDIIKYNPYRLADDIFGIGFKMSDDLAMKSGVEKKSPFRIKAAIKYVLTQATSEGHVYLPKYRVLRNTNELLDLDLSLIEDNLLELQMEHNIWQDTVNEEEVVYLNTYYYAEMAVAKKIIELSKNFKPIKYVDLDNTIAKIEEEQEKFLANNQKEAVKEAINNGVLIVTGGPGTGKTTTINTIINLLLKEDQKIVLAAPTGRASKRMTEATGQEAQTIHRLLGINFLDDENKKQIFDKNDETPLEADVIIIDETSMVDIMLMHSLLKAISLGTKLILVGDVDQLPSVGAGNVLKDIIRSEKIKVVCLTEIFRQAQESAIIMNAHRINNGEEPILNEKDKDFFFLKRTTTDGVLDTIKELLTTRLPSFKKNLDSKTDIQILTPMRKNAVGVENLNLVLQNTLNPKSDNKKEKEFRATTFRVGDKVMQIKNNYNIVWQTNFDGVCEDGLGVFNGDQGIINDINEKDSNLKVLFDDGKMVVYDYTQLDELELAYAITIHKSQGSEYPVIIIPIHSGPPMLMSKNLLYTAVTRAKELVIIVGLKETIVKMINNNREVNRFTSLTLRINELYEIMC